MRARHPSWRRVAQDAGPGPMRLGRLVEAVCPGAACSAPTVPLLITV